MSVRNKNLTLVGAAGAALALTAAVAAPALAAGKATADVTYSCASGAAAPTASYSVKAPPAKMAAGQTVKLATTSKLTLSGADSGLAETVLGTGTDGAFSGTISTDTSSKAVGQDLKVAKTSFATPGNPTTANAKGNTLLRSTKVGTFTLKLGDIGLVHLQGYDNSGAKTATFDFPSSDGTFGPCTNAGGSTTLKSGGKSATVKVVADKTKTTASGSASKGAAKVSAKVKSHFGLKATGKVKFTLKKGSKTVGTASGTIKKGVAKAGFKGVSKGKYSVTAKYAGNKSLKGSSGSASFTAK